MEMNLWLTRIVIINEDGGQNENGGQSDIKSLTMATCQLPCPQIGQFAGERRNPRFSSPPEISHLPQPENLPKLNKIGQGGNGIYNSSVSI